MTNSYLAIARQGRNAWWRYPLCLLLALGLTVNVTVYVALPFIVWMAMRGVSLPSSNEIWPREPVGFFAFTIVVSGLMTFGLALAIAPIHQRSWRTVINPTSQIHWRRLAQGTSVWLGLMLLNIGLLAWLDRDRYLMQFSGGWLWRWLPTLVAVPLAALMPSLVYGYLLQGLGLLIPRPSRLLAVVVGLIGCIGLVASLPSPSLLDWAASVITAGFMVWIVLQDQGLELFIGIQAANWLIKVQIVSAPDIPPFFAPLLTLQAAETTGIGFVTWLMRLGLFYAICFLWLPRRNWEDSAGG